MFFLTQGMQGFETRFNATTDKVIANTNVETSIIPTGVGTMMIPANWLLPGRSIRLTWGGIYSTGLTLIGNATFRAKLGGVTVASGGTGTLLSSASNAGMGGNLTFTCRTAGTTGTISGSGTAWYSVGGNQRAFVDLNNASTASIDTTQDNMVDLSYQWANISTNNSMTTKYAVLELLENTP